MTIAETKPTYMETKDFIYKETGEKVSHLNIAQVKRKLGLIERKNYNISKSEKMQPRLTIEKRKL
ncbi:MAG: 23S rRNA methyltransferase [Anaerolineaceae bacterium]